MEVLNRETLIHVLTCVVVVLLFALPLVACGLRLVCKSKDQTETKSAVFDKKRVRKAPATSTTEKEERKSNVWKRGGQKIRNGFGKVADAFPGRRLANRDKNEVEPGRFKKGFLAVLYYLVPNRFRSLFNKWIAPSKFQVVVVVMFGVVIVMFGVITGQLMSIQHQNSITHQNLAQILGNQKTMMELLNKTIQDLGKTFTATVYGTAENVVHVAGKAYSYLHGMIDSTYDRVLKIFG